MQRENGTYLCVVRSGYLPFLHALSMGIGHFLSVHAWLEVATFLPELRQRGKNDCWHIFTVPARLVGRKTSPVIFFCPINCGVVNISSSLALFIMCIYLAGKGQ